jgi:ATP/maltotriose-dependent transcriptional regulator MalT
MAKPTHRPTQEPRTTPLIGRDGPIRQLIAGLDAASRGLPCLVEVTGEPGIGKTRLLHTAGLLARDRQFAVLVAGAATLAGAGSQPGAGRPYGTLLALLDGAGTGAAERLTPSVADRRLRESLRRASTPHGGPLILLDDLHQADQESLRALTRLLRVPPDGLAVVVAHRPRQATETMLAALDAAAGVHREMINLGALDAVETAQLLGVPPGPEVERVRRLAEGNPLYLSAYKPLLHSRAQPATEALSEELPDEVARALQAELATLSAEEYTVAQAAAVLADGFDPALAPAVAHVDPHRCPAVLDRLVTRDLLRADLHEQPGLRYRHPVVRAAVYRSLSPSRRRGMHADAATVLRRLGRPPVEYAEHVARSAVPGDGEAADTLLAAAGGPVAAATAVRWLSVARGLVPPGADRLAGDVDLELAGALAATGRLTDARTLLQDMACAPDPDEGHRLRTLLAWAQVERLRGRPKDAVAVLRPQLCPLPEGPDHLRAALAAEAAICSVMYGSKRNGGLYADQARDLSAGSTDALLSVRIDVAEAFVQVHHGSPDPALLDRAAEQADPQPDGKLSGSLDLLHLLGWAESFAERDREALDHFARGLEIARQAAHAPLLPYLLLGRSRVACRLGQLERAEQDALAAERYARELELPALAGLARTLQAGAVYWRVGPGAAHPLAESALTDAPARERDWFREIGWRVAARLRHQCHEPTDTLATLLRSCGGPDLAWVEACSRPYWAAMLADMARRAKQPEQVEHWVREAQRHADAVGLRGQAAHATMARARWALDTGCPTAVPLAAEAAHSYAELGWLPDEGSARLVYAAALGAARHWRVAEAQLAEVRRIADMVGSRTLHNAVVAQQRRVAARAGAAGRRAEPDAGGQARPAQLTRREWDIVQLVAAGVSNAEVADRLFVTVKTVEAHLTRIFRKLGVSSRVGLVVAVTGGVDEPES